MRIDVAAGIDVFFIRAKNKYYPLIASYWEAKEHLTNL
jgi:hypothetical protein